MKLRDDEYLFNTKKVVDLWKALYDEQILCDKKQIEVYVKSSSKSKKKVKFVAENKIICATTRIEDGLKYINSLVLLPRCHEIANDFVEFINCEYVVIHCIKELAKIFGADYKKITDERESFKEFSYGHGSDDEVFEYLRSLCAVHPVETSFHPTVHSLENFDCCSRIVWDKGYNINDVRDLTAVVYSSDCGKEEKYIGISVKWFVSYLNKWIEFIDKIIETINGFIESEEERYRNLIMCNPDKFDDYVEYIDYLKMEYLKRIGYLNIDYFETYKLAFLIKFDDKDINEKNECYKNALKYMFGFLHNQMQYMSEREYTGIVDLDDNDYTTLFYEMYFPVASGSNFSNDRGAFAYIDNLNSRYSYDVRHARQVLDDIKPLVNNYVKFNNDEPMEITSLLIQIATYFDALQYNGYIGRSIPKDIKYRGKNDD